MLTEYTKSQLDDASIDGSRIIGSVECEEASDVAEVEKVLNEKGFTSLSLKSVYSPAVVVYFKDKTSEVKEALDLYTRYELTGSDDRPGYVQGLNEEEHRLLGKAFGYSPEEIDIFVEESGVLDK